jgi:hypothetical protein
MFMLCYVMLCYVMLSVSVISSKFDICYNCFIFIYFLEIIVNNVIVSAV